jgi:hypothetical protein
MANLTSGSGLYLLLSVSKLTPGSNMADHPIFQGGTSLVFMVGKKLLNPVMHEVWHNINGALRVLLYPQVLRSNG